MASFDFMKLTSAAVLSSPDGQIKVEVKMPGLHYYVISGKGSSNGSGNSSARMRTNGRILPLAWQKEN